MNSKNDNPDAAQDPTNADKGVEPTKPAKKPPAPSPPRSSHVAWLIPAILVLVGAIVGFGWCMSMDSGITAAVLGGLLGLGGKSLLDEVRKKGTWKAEPVLQIAWMLLAMSVGVILGLLLGYLVRGDFTASGAPRSLIQKIDEVKASIDKAGNNQDLLEKLDALKHQLSADAGFRLNDARRTVQATDEVAEFADGFALSFPNGSTEAALFRKLADELNDADRDVRTAPASLGEVRHKFPGILKAELPTDVSQENLKALQTKLDELFPPPETPTGENRK